MLNWFGRTKTLKRRRILMSGSNVKISWCQHHFQLYWIRCVPTATISHQADVNPVWLVQHELFFPSIWYHAMHTAMHIGDGRERLCSIGDNRSRHLLWNFQYYKKQIMHAVLHIFVTSLYWVYILWSLCHIRCYIQFISMAQLRPPICFVHLRYKTRM